MKPVTPPPLLLLLLLFFQNSRSLVPADGVCSIFVFAPFTDPGGNVISGDTIGDTGFSQMAAAFMAQEQFNSRNATVVPELASLGDDCNVTIHISNTSVFDSVPDTHNASQQLIATGETPCAIVGPSSDLVALELATVAQAAQYPIVIARAFNLRLSYKQYQSFAASLYPDVQSTAYALGGFLNLTKRTNYIALLYEQSDTGMQRREALQIMFDDIDVEFYSVGYTNDASSNELAVGEVKTPLDAMTAIRDIGYRTIILAMDRPVQSFQAIADAAEQLRMNNGEYFYVWFDIVTYPADWTANSNATKLTDGSGWTTAIDNYLVNSSNPFLPSWRQQNSTLVDLINAANPMEDAQDAPPDYFQTTDPSPFGAASIYDAVMSVGLAACRAPRTDDTVLGTDHVSTILNLTFSGASGPVEFSYSTDERSSRQINTATFGGMNIRNGTWNMSAVVYPETDIEWQELTSFVYADGTTTSPQPLKDPPSQNYIPTGLRAYGLSLMSVVIVLALLSMAWVFVHRKERAIASFQPMFIYVILLGAISQAWTIFVISFDEGAGWSAAELDGACISVPWLMTIGHILTYSGIFTKLWRIHKTLQFTRRRVEMKQLVKPMIALLLLSVSILSLWTAFDPLHWSRDETNDVTGASVGQCQSSHMARYAIPLVLVCSLPTFLAAIMAYKTRDVVSDLAESFWIFILILVQIEAIMIAAPVAVLMRNQTTGGQRYATFVVLIWILPMSTVCFLMIPKYVSYRRAAKDARQKSAQAVSPSIPGSECGRSRTIIVGSLQEKSKATINEQGQDGKNTTDSLMSDEEVRPGDGAPQD